MKEIWRTVVEYPLYEVSSLGRVRRVQAARGTRHTVRGGIYILSPGVSAGYPVVALYDGHGKKISKRIHILVAAAFLGKRPPKHQVNHKNGDCQNNKPKNLEYTTATKKREEATKRGAYKGWSRARGSRSRKRKMNHTISDLKGGGA